MEQNSVFQNCDDKDQLAYHLFVEDESHIIAYLRILPRGVKYDEISIGRVVVSKQHRGKGIARQMMLKAIKYVEEVLNESDIRFSAQAYLLHFYQSMG